MAWWREARFGLFIHWGLYAQPAGVWKGEEIPVNWLFRSVTGSWKQISLQQAAHSMK